MYCARRNWRRPPGMEPDRKMAGQARRFFIPIRCPGGAEHSAQAEELLLISLLGLLRLLSLLRFLSHSILSGFNGLKRDTRGMLGGGPASQNPRLTPKQIRRPVTSHRHLSVIALSTDVCVLTGFFPEMRADERFSRRNSHLARVLARACHP